MFAEDHQRIDLDGDLTYLNLVFGAFGERLRVKVRSEASIVSVASK